MRKTDKQRAIEIIASMKRNYGNKKEKYLIDKEIEYLATKHKITYGDMIEFSKKYKYDRIMKDWIKK